MLRLLPSGAAPADNPFGNAVSAYGFRNVFGFDFDPATGQLWAIDNGPTPYYADDPPGLGPLKGCNDEIDRVVKGGNCGWGATGSCEKPPDAPLNTNRDGPAPILPAENIEVASGVTGARFCDRCGLGPRLDGRLLYVDFDFNHGDGEIRAVTLSADRTVIVSDELVYQAPGPSPLSVERGPDGTMYFSTSSGIFKLTDTTTVPPPPTTSPPTTSPPTTSPPTTGPPPAGGCPCSIWGPGAVPGNVYASGHPVELGVKFRVDVDGAIAGVRYYQPAGDTGAHQVNLWSSSGALLATATASGSSGSGWQQVNFATPVPVWAATTYVASFHTDGGMFGYDFNFFAQAGVDRGPMHALRDGADGGNGLYLYGPSAFPVESLSATNFWVDVTFTAP